MKTMKNIIVALAGLLVIASCSNEVTPLASSISVDTEEICQCKGRWGLGNHRSAVDFSRAFCRKRRCRSQHIRKIREHGRFRCSCLRQREIRGRLSYSRGSAVGSHRCFRCQAGGEQGASGFNVFLYPSPEQLQERSREFRRERCVCRPVGYAGR